MQTYRLKRKITELQAQELAGKYLDENSYDILIDHDADGFDINGNLLFRFRKHAVPMETLMVGVDNFKHSITLTDGRGMASGGYTKRLKKDGSESNISISKKKVYSGNVGYMDASSMIHYCRKTAFARDYFDKFKAGIPFVKCISGLYEQLAPDHYRLQKAISEGTNPNYMIPETVFTTVTVNKNFQTSVHKDSGDLPRGFGNLCVYREGHYEGSYFVLPEYGVAIDMHNTDILFVDVHKWHGNTPFVNCSEDYLRIAFVMYYREYMYMCKQPKEELMKIKMESGGFYTL